MTTLLFVRHGQSRANIEKRFAGALNSPLTELGRTQAAATARYIAEHYTVDAVYASDLDRAFYTGKAVAELTGTPLTPDRNLREIAAGDWEGIPFDDLATRFADSYQIWLHNIGEATCDGGESVAQLQARVVACIRRIVAEHPNQTVVIATHATPIRTFQCFCEGRPLAQMKTIPWVSNASVTAVRFENGEFSLAEVDQHDHLGALASLLPANV